MFLAVPVLNLRDKQMDVSPTTNKILYLSQESITAINLPMIEIINAVEFSLIEKAYGRTEMPPKHWIPVNEQRFFSAMSSAVPTCDVAVCKWQSGSALNNNFGLPYLTGLLMINSLETGLTLAIMDATWITAKRTAAASAVAIRHLARTDADVVGIIGCGIQGRMHVEAILAIWPKIRQLRAYDILPTSLDRYCTEIQQTQGLNVVSCNNAREVAAGAHVVITGGPIEPNAQRVMESGWLEKGALGIAIDYDCYWKPSAMHAVDQFFTDDIIQMEHLKEYGYFADIPNIQNELGRVAANLCPGRSSNNDTFLTVNLGVSVEDAIIAKKLYETAKETGSGTWVDF